MPLKPLNLNYFYDKQAEQFNFSVSLKRCSLIGTTEMCLLRLRCCTV